MSQFPIHNQTAHIARQTLATSEQTGDRTLKMMGLAALILTSAAGLLHGLRQLWKDVGSSRSGHGGGNGRGYGYVSQTMPEPDPQPSSGQQHNEADGHQRSWAGRRELSSHNPAADHAQAAHRARLGSVKER